MVNPDPQVDVVGVGLNATDTMIRLPHFPSLGSKVGFHSADILPGGQVASAMAACQQWGLRTRYVGKVGEDNAAAVHRAEFARLGVETHLLTANACDSQQAVILVDDAGERTVLWKRDSRLILRPDELKREWIANARTLHVDGHDTEAAALAACWAREAGIPVVADLDDLYSGVEALLPNIDYLITSRDIPERLCGEEDLHKSLPEVRERFALPHRRGDSRTRRRAGLGRLAIPLRSRIPSRDRRHHGRRRHLPRRIYLRASARMAGRAAVGFRVCRCRSELRGNRGPRRDSAGKADRSAHGQWDPSPARLRLKFCSQSTRRVQQISFYKSLRR